MFRKPYTDEEIKNVYGDERNHRLIANDTYLTSRIAIVIFAIAIVALIISELLANQ